MRLFFAVPFTEEIRGKLCDVIQTLRPCCQRGRFTRPENLHLTLAFLGECSPRQTAAAKDALQGVEGEPFFLHIGGMGCFRRPEGDLYWAGVERSPGLLKICDSLSRELRKHGFHMESRPYRPHLTLVRQAVLTEDCDRSAFVVPLMDMKVEVLCLVRSERFRSGPVYTRIAEKNLTEEKAG